MEAGNFPGKLCSVPQRSLWIQSRQRSGPTKFVLRFDCACGGRLQSDGQIWQGWKMEATNYGWQHAPTPLHAGVMRSAIAGAVWTQDRRHRARMVPSPLCPHCDQQVPEDLPHLWWTCPKWEKIRQQHSKALTLRRSTWPACLGCCGIIPDDLREVTAVRIEIASHVHLMMAAILLERGSAQEAADKADTAPVPSSSDGYPWAWDPSGPKEVFLVEIRDGPRSTSWRAQEPLVLALQEYLRQLRWPVTQPVLAVTYVELALDYEVAMGVDLPPVPSRLDTAQVPIADRARGFAMLLRMLREVAAPALVHPGEHRYNVHSLAPLGVPPSAGLTRRPVLLGGAQTERLLKQLTRVCSQRVEQAAGPQKQKAVRNPAHSGWAEHFVPQHAPDRVMQWTRWGGRVTSYGSRAGWQAKAKSRAKAKREKANSSQPKGPCSPPAQRRRTGKGAESPKGPKVLTSGDAAPRRTTKVGSSSKRGLSPVGVGETPGRGFGPVGSPRCPKRARHGRGNPEARVC